MSEPQTEPLNPTPCAGELDPGAEEREIEPKPGAESIEATSGAGNGCSSGRTGEDASAAAEHEAVAASSGRDDPAEVESDVAAAARAELSRVDRARKQRTASLYRSFRTGRALEGRIEKVIKGGYSIRLGKVGGFCPHSQVDLSRVENPEDLVGKSFLFRITQLRRAGEDVVVSRRVLLEEERREEAKAVRATLIEGAVMQGRVAGLAAFGAFVDLGAGVLGLVHVSELSHGRVRRVEDAVKVGQPVQVKVLKVDEQRGRLSLSMRQAQDDPWESVDARFAVGSVYPGTAVRVADFGAFVELETGVEALAPSGEFPPSSAGWKQHLELGTQGNWLVLSIDAKQRRMSVAPMVDGQQPLSAAALEVGAELRGKVQRIESFGVFVWLAAGCVGLMPNATSGTSRGADMQREFPVGQDLDVVVLDVEAGGRRIRLARKGVRVEPRPQAQSAAPRPAARPPKQPRPQRQAPADPPPAQPGFGSLLADKLKAALDQPGGS